MRIRDAVWQDMEFSPKEEAIIRSPTFQRLHGIKQLGNGLHIYPCATHTRFSHSLGVCHVSKMLCEQIAIQGEELEEIALAALLHDITHVPFAHTLAGQLALLPGWEEKAAYEKRFKDLQEEIAAMKLPEVDPKEKRQLVDLLGSQDLVNVASASLDDLKNPYPAELIADSFCADLLDYLFRDVYFTGLTREYDLRIVDHAALLTDQDGIRHFGLDITVDSPMNHRARSPSIVHEYIHLLEIRFTLSQSVYFYGPKLAADALLGKAFRIMLHEGSTIGDKPPKDYLYDASDELFVQALCNHPNPDVKYLGKRLKHRDLPRCALEMDGAGLTDTQLSLINLTFRGSIRLSEWRDIERDIAAKAGLSPADILIYSQKPEMSLKGANALIHDEDGEVRQLTKHKEIPRAKMLEDDHRALWRLYVFSGETDLDTCHKVRAIAREVLSEFLAQAS